MNGTLKIGWAQRDISTVEPVGITGQFYLRVSKGVADPITCTALAIENGRESVIMVSVDATAVRPVVLDRVRDILRRELPEIEPEKISFNATHSHTSAWSMPGHPGEDYPLPPSIRVVLPEEYYPFLVRQLADAVTEAWQKRRAGGFAFGLDYAPVAHSRRVWYADDISERPGAEKCFGLMLDGHARMYGDTGDPKFSHYEAGADHCIQFLYTVDGEGRMTGVIVNLSCPSQCSMEDEMLSADYWHETRQEIRRRHGAGFFVLGQCAPAGDLETFPLHNLRGEERRLRLSGKSRRQEIAVRIADAMDRVSEWAGQAVAYEAEINNELLPLDLPVRRITEQEYREELAAREILNAKQFAGSGTPEERLKHDSVLYSLRMRNRSVITRYESQEAHPYRRIFAHLFRIGEVAFATSPFELFSDFMHRIQGRSPFEQTFCVQLADDSLGYLATGRGAAGRGYSATRYCNQVAPEGGQRLVDATVDVFNRWLPEPRPLPRREIQTLLLQKMFTRS